MQYNVRLEFDVESTDFADVTIEATSPEEAKRIAIAKYDEGLLDLDYRAGGEMESSLAVRNLSEWLVETKGN